MRKFTVYRQPNTMDCGPTCLKMIASFHGRSIGMEQIRQAAGFSKQGVSLLGIAEAAENIGFRSQGVQLSLVQLLNDISDPCILHWNQNHFVVFIPKKHKKKIYVADPAQGLLTYSRTDFSRQWISSADEDGTGMGIALLIEPTPKFFESSFSSEAANGRSEGKLGWRHLSAYLKPHKRFALHLALAIIMVSLIQFVLPFLTQSIVDKGVNSQDLSYITLILIAQLMLFLGRTAIEFIRSRILLHVSTRFNISILSDFWIKVMRLPIGYFDTKHAGDTIQRIGDHKRIEAFLTGTALSTIFSLFNLLVFSVVLLKYSQTVFFVFIGGSVLYFLWIRIFLAFRRRLEYERFDAASKANNLTVQLIHGMQEIKLHNAEQQRRWEWENTQVSLFKLSFRSLSINQYQQAGALFINEGKNIFITFLVAQLVINGELTLGMMLSITYIIGQLNSPVEQLIGFTQSYQDAKISLDRLNEIHKLEEEEPAGVNFERILPDNLSIDIKGLSFRYPGAGNEPVLRNINLIIPNNKVTAIVGVSGSGKTTLLKLLNRFYEDYQGDIKLGAISLRSVSPRLWRSQCASVMQEGFIFNDSIASNIALGVAVPDRSRLIYACRIANILGFVESLPLGFNTRIGAEGLGISSGQKQRMLIARAIYKDPKILFFDEATNALDANNEKEIVENLQSFFQNKTVVVVAHRLSTVMNADNIVVLHNGEIVESGSHEVLIYKKGRYYELVRNQLELGQ